MKASYRERKAVAEFDPQQVSAEQIARVINDRTYYRATIASVTEGPFPSTAPPAGGATGSAVVARLNASWFVDAINSRTPFRARLLQAAQPEGADRGLPSLWIAAIAVGVAGGGILGWYALVRGRRKPASAPSSRQKQTGHR